MDESGVHTFIERWAGFIPQPYLPQFGHEIGNLAGGIVSEFLLAEATDSKPCFCRYELTPVMCPTHGVLNG